MLEPTLFVAVDHHVKDRIVELHATVAEVRPPQRRPGGLDAGLVTRTRSTVGRFLVSVGTSLSGQPQS